MFNFAIYVALKTLHGRNKQHITRVNCEVNACRHYAQGNHCIAKNIHIQPKNASSSQQTDCGTFEMK